MRKKIKEKGEISTGVEIILLGLKEAYEKDEGTFLLSKKSTSKTQLCTKILTSGFFEDVIEFT